MNIITHLNLKKWADNNISVRAQGQYKIVNGGIKVLDGNSFLYFDYANSAPLNVRILIPINNTPKNFQILDTNGFDIIYLAKDILRDNKRKLKLSTITKPIHYKYLKPKTSIK